MPTLRYATLTYLTVSVLAGAEVHQAPRPRLAAAPVRTQCFINTEHTPKYSLALSTVKDVLADDVLAFLKKAPKQETSTARQARWDENDWRLKVQQRSQGLRDGLLTEKRAVESRVRELVAEALKIAPKEIGDVSHDWNVKHFNAGPKAESGADLYELTDWIRRGRKIVMNGHRDADLATAIGELPAVRSYKRQLEEAYQPLADEMKQLTRKVTALPLGQDDPDFPSLQAAIDHLREEEIEPLADALRSLRDPGAIDRFRDEPKSARSPPRSAILRELDAAPELAARARRMNLGQGIANELLQLDEQLLDRLAQADDVSKKYQSEVHRLLEVLGGATTDLAFAIGIHTEADGTPHLLTLVPLTGNAKHQGLGIGIRFFEADPTMDSKALNARAKEAVSGLLESPRITAASALHCIEPKR